MISKKRGEAGGTGENCAAVPFDSPSAAEIDAYIATQVATGKYPHLAEFGGKKKVMSLGVKAEAFEAGLDWLLAGIEAEVGPAGESA